MKNNIVFLVSLSILCSSFGCAYHGGNIARGYQDLVFKTTNRYPIDLIVKPVKYTPVPNDSAIYYLFLVIPFWPYVTTVQEGGRKQHYPAGYLADQLRKSGFFRSVRIVSDVEEVASKYVLDIKLNRSLIQETRTTYGLSVTGAILQLLLGLPSGSRTFEMEVRVRLFDSTGDVFLDKTYFEQDKCLTGVFAPLWVYGPQFSYGEHNNLMILLGESITRQIIDDIITKFSQN